MPKSLGRLRGHNTNEECSIPHVQLSNEALRDEVIRRAENNMLSEAYCLEMAQAYYEAAEIARQRRSVPRRTPDLWDDSLRERP